MTDEELEDREELLVARLSRLPSKLEIRLKKTSEINVLSAEPSASSIRTIPTLLPIERVIAGLDDEEEETDGPTHDREGGRRA